MSGYGDEEGAAASFQAALNAFHEANSKGIPRKNLVNVGGKPLLYYLPLTIAEEKGFFKEFGVEPELVFFQAAAPIARRCWSMTAAPVVVVAAAGAARSAAWH